MVHWFFFSPLMQKPYSRNSCRKETVSQWSIIIWALGLCSDSEPHEGLIYQSSQCRGTDSHYSCKYIPLSIWIVNHQLQLLFIGYSLINPLPLSSNIQRFHSHLSSSGLSTGCLLTVLIAASLKAFVIVQAVGLDAVVPVSSIHKCHSESIPFLCPQDRTWTNAGEYYNQTRGVEGT